MKHIELSPKTNFQSWDTSRLNEFRKENFSFDLGQRLLFEGNDFRLWELCLKHKERWSFRKLENDFSYTSISDASAVIHVGDGRILFSQFQRGDVQFIKASPEKPMIVDIENSSLTDLKLILTEIILPTDSFP